MKITNQQLETVQRAMSQFKNITGAAFTIKDGSVQLQLSVSEKRPLSQLSSSEILPSEFEGYKVCVEERNPTLPAFAKAQIENQLGDSSGNLMDQFSYLAPGQSCGQTASTNGGTGTLGCILKDNQGKFLGLTNFHVAPAVGQPVYQPGPDDAQRFGYALNPVGFVRRITSSMMDVSVFDLNLGVKWRNTPVGQTYSIKSAIEPEIGKVYQKVGRTTAFTQAQCVSIGMIRLSYFVGERDIYSFELRPISHGLATPIDEEISDSGDSGCIWTDGLGHAAGLNFAGEGVKGAQYERAYACPMVNVLNFLKMQIAEAADQTGTIDAIEQAANAAWSALQSQKTHLAAIETHIGLIRTLIKNNNNNK